MNLTRADDAELLHAHRAGDADALAEIFRRHAGWLTAIAQRRVRDPALADDVVQAVFVVLAHDPARVSPGRPLVGWLYRAAHLAAAHAMRGEARRRRHEREAAMQHEMRADDRTAAVIDAVDAIERVLGSLRPMLREAILLHYYECRSLANAAAETAISPDAFRKRVARAIDALHDRLTRGGITMPAIAIQSTLAAPSTALLAGPRVWSTPRGTATSLAARVRRSFALRRTIAPALTATAAVACALVAAVTTRPAVSRSMPAAVARVSAPTTQRVDVATRANELLYQIRASTLTSTSRQWAEAVLGLIDLGPPAVPAIVAELDRTDRDLELRLLPIALRAIGDRRAVPALARALPRTALHTSDFGLQLPRDVATALLPHLIEPESDARFDTRTSLSIGVGRSIREVTTSLQRLTGRAVASADDAFREPDGGQWPASRVRAFRADLANRWLAANDAVAATRPVDAIAAAGPAGDDLVERAGIARFGPLFPNHARLGVIHHTTIRAQGTADSPAFFDFETGRAFEWLEGVDALRDPRAARDFDAWSSGLGIDLTMSQSFYEHQLVPPATRPGENYENCRHVAAPETFTMRLWPVPAVRWETFAKEVAGDAPIDPGAGPTENFAAGTATVDDGSRTFLFITADETRGILRFGPQDATATHRSIEYRLIDRPESRGGDVLSDGIRTAAADIARPWPATRPVAFGDLHRVTLATPDGDRPSALDLKSGRVLPMPSALAGATFDAFRRRREWAIAHDADVLPTYGLNAPASGVEILGVAVADLDDAAWRDASASRTLERAHRVARRADDPVAFVTTAMPRWGSTQTRCVRTDAGTIALLRLVGVDPAAGTVTIEYKCVEERP